MTDSLQERVVAAIGRQYELEGEIGRGGMSVVYRARDLRLNRLVAIKVLPPELAYDPAIRTRFTREAQTSAQLSHAHIVPIHDVDDRDGIAYFVMAIIGGGNLAALLAREPLQPIEEVRRLLREIADALAYAHLRGIIHRDIKPDNILLDAESGRAMVTDFGIARAVEAGTRLTLTGVAVGTPTYMSPEQAMGEREVDGRSDIYSLGVLAYQMLTGRVPFTAGNSMALLLKHVGEKPRPIAELRPDTPKAMIDVIERALMKAPEDRWPTAGAMRDALASDKAAAASWRSESREPVRYPSPRPESARAEPQAVSPRRGSAAVAARSASPVPRRPGSAIVLVPEHLASLTPSQREDLRLWRGRIDLLDRMKFARRFALLTLAATVGGMVGFVAGIDKMPPLVLSPLVPAYFWMKLWRRSMSLRESGLRLRRVYFMLRARWALPMPLAAPSDRKLLKLTSREVLDSPYGTAVRRAAEDRAAISAIVASLPKPDRALLPDIDPTARSLVERVVELAQSLHRLDQGFDPKLIGELGARITDEEKAGASTDAERQLGLLRRQRGTLEELAARRAVLVRQLDSAGLALGNLRLDLLKLRSSGLPSALSDVSTATQEARALSKDIGSVLDAVAEVRGL
jgi:serine/threonine-protein kinase